MNNDCAQFSRRHKPSIRRKLLKHWLSLIGLGLVASVVVVAILAGHIAPQSPVTIDIMSRLKTPGFVYPQSGVTAWLGTDHLGRDVLSRVIFGSRISLIVSLPAVVFSLMLGVTLGLLAGYYRGWIEIIVMRLVDLQLAFPFILLAICIIALLGPSLLNMVIVFAITAWPVYARTVRGITLSLKEREFVLAARALGARNSRILLLDILPNLLNPLLVLASFEVARIILLESAMGFLGLGIQPPTPTWGNMLADGRDNIRDAWWLTTFPGIAIMITAAGVNFIGDALRDIFDPTLQNIE